MCTGVDFWGFIRVLESNFRGDRTVTIVADGDESSAYDGDFDCADLSPKELKQMAKNPRWKKMARNPRLHADSSVQGLVNQWNGFTDGPLTQRIESIEDWEHLWAHKGLAEAASEHGLWARHQQHRVQRTPTFDESLNWFTHRYVEPKGVTTCA